MILSKKLFNFIIIYFLILKKKLSGCKIIIFHHPSHKLIENTDVYIKYLFSNVREDYVIIYTHELIGLNKKKYFFITQGYLKLIFGVNFFISSYVCDHFTPNSKKIYIHHDIYDTPLAEEKKYKGIVRKISNYDYIFVSSNITKKFFENNFKRFSIKNSPSVIKTGYIKFDLLENKLNHLKKKNNIIVIAPTNFNAYKKSLLIKNINTLISKLLNYRNYKIVLRPHPSNKDDTIIKNLKKRFSHNNNFLVNLDKNYLKLYSSSLCLITDISGTAYTYSFLTKNPVVFFDYTNHKIKDSNFFKDRKKIGYICNSTRSIMLKIKKIINNKYLFKKKIDTLKKERLYNLKNVRNYMLNFIYKN